MKEELIKLLNDKYSEYKSFQRSQSTSYDVYCSDMSSVNLVMEELTPYCNAGLVDGLSINYLPNKHLKPYKIMFNVDFGYKDGIEHKILEFN